MIHKVSNRKIRERLSIKEDLIQRVMKRKLNLFGQIMNDIRKLRSVMMGVMEENQRRGKPCIESGLVRLEKGAMRRLTH